MPRTFHQLHVSNPASPERERLTLTFTNKKAYHAADVELYRLGYEVERCPGYALFDDFTKSPDRTLASVKAFLKTPVAARYGGE
jgi:hypothetical protein